MGKKEKRNYEDMDCLEVNLNVKAVKEIGSRPESLQPVSHLALGKKVTYNSKWFCTLSRYEL